MNKEELITRSELTKSEVWQAIRERALTRIVSVGAAGCKDGNITAGWLELIKYIDSWPSELDKALRIAKKDEE